MAGVFVLRGGNGGRRALDPDASPVQAVGLAHSLSEERGCRVLVTRDGLTLAAFDRGRMIDPAMADFPEAIPSKHKRMQHDARR